MNLYQSLIQFFTVGGHNFALILCTLTLKTEDLSIVQMPGGCLRFLGICASTLESQTREFLWIEWYSRPETGYLASFCRKM